MSKLMKRKAVTGKAENSREQTEPGGVRHLFAGLRSVTGIVMPNSLELEFLNSPASASRKPQENQWHLIDIKFGEIKSVRSATSGAAHAPGR